MQDGADGADLPAGSAGLNEPTWDLAVLGAKRLRPQDPEVVGPYRIHALLGVGGMGRVYLGRPDGVPLGAGRGRAGSWVAVKVIRPDLADNPTFRQRFTRELEAVGRVNTPHAAALVRGDADADHPWMATEFVPGVALDDAAKSGQVLPESAAWRLAHDVGSALIAVHRAGIVHRDVKPSNIILAATGAKIIDFGVARGADLNQLTTTGLNVGTPSYMAPEQARSSELTSAADMFSVGVSLYFAVSGRLPFGESTGPASAMLFRVLYGDPDLSGLEDVGPGLRDLIVRCLAKEPVERPSSMRMVDMARAAATEGLWQPGEVAQWPPALAVRIGERTRAAERDPHAGAPVAAPPDPEPSDGGVRPVSQASRTPEQRSSGRRRSVGFGGAAATAVVAVGVISMFVWGNGNGDTSNQPVATGSGAATLPAGAAGSSSPGAGGAGGPGSSSTARASSRAGGSVGASSSASDASHSRGPSQSPSPSAIGSSASTVPTSSSPTVSPVNTGCAGWSVQHIGSAVGQTNAGRPVNLHAGPSATCAPVSPPVAHGDKLALWCYVVNGAGVSWSYVQDTAKGTYGWIPDADLAGGAGASGKC